MLNAEEMLIWAQGLKQSTRYWKNFEFDIIAEVDLVEAADKIDERLPGLKPIQGTQSFHGFIPVDEDKIMVFAFSSQISDTVVSLNRNAQSTSETSKKHPQQSQPNSSAINLRKKARCNYKV